MSSWSDAKAATALGLLQRRGMVMTVTRPSAVQTASGDRSAAASLGTARGVLIRAKGSDVSGQRNSDRILMSSMSTPPAPGDLVSVPAGPDSGLWHVSWATNMAPDGGTIYHELGVDR